MADEGSSELERLRARVSELEHTAERYRLLVESTGVVQWEADADHRFTYVSPHAARLLGSPPEGWLAPGFWSERLHPDDRQRAEADRGLPLDCVTEYRLRHADGSYRWVRDIASVIVGPDGRPAGRRGVLCCVTAEREPQAEREQWVQVFEQAGWGLAIADPVERRLVRVNHAFARMYGGEPEDFVGRPIADCVAPESLQTVEDHLAAPAGGSVTLEGLARRLDGTTFPVRVITSGVRDAEGRVVWRAGLMVDMSELHAERERNVELEHQLRQSQKLEAVGLLASGIAHDFNNHLTVILGCAELLRELAADADQAELARSIVRASNAAAQVTSQLLAFARAQQRTPRAIDLNRYLRATLELLERLLPEDIRLRPDVSRAPLVVLADPAQLEQVVLNLALNARDAMSGSGGELRVRTRDEDGSALLEVEDTGCGMSAEVRERIFEPFFSTKPTVEGSGLGLATVHGIVEQNGWRIGVESQPGAGSTFRLWVPLAEVEPAPDGRREEPEAAAVARILVAEDDDGVAGVVCQSLRAAGHEVVRAADGVEALERLEADGRFDLLLSDVIMPRMRGGELLHHVRRRYPALRVLFMSGYADDELQASGERLLPKPFSPAHLQAVVQDVLSGE